MSCHQLRRSHYCWQRPGKWHEAKNCRVWVRLFWV